jgi:hypothetical protein
MQPEIVIDKHDQCAPQVPTDFNSEIFAKLSHGPVGGDKPLAFSQFVEITGILLSYGGG